MGQIVFWLEAAVSSALFVALGLAILARTQRRGRRWALRIVWCILAPLPWVLAIGGFAAVQIFARGALFPLVCSATAGAAFLVAAVIVIRRGRRRPTPEEARQAARWRLNRLSLAMAAAAMLTCITFWNLDLSVRQEMAALRVQAGVLALSVAPPQVPDSQNAALLYHQAWETLKAWDGKDEDWRESVSRWLDPEKGQFNPDDPEMLAFLRKSAPVLDLLRQAGERPGCNFGIDYSSPSPFTVLPPLYELRSLARLLNLSARVHASHGRMTEAMKDLGASFAMADHLAPEPILITTLVAVAFESLTFDSFQRVLDQGPVDTEALSALKVYPQLSFNRALYRSIRMEEALGLSIFADADPLTTWLQEMDSSPLGIGGPGLLLRAPYRVFLSRQDASSYIQIMQRYEKLSARPYHESREWWNSAAAARSRGLGGLLASSLASSYYRVAEQAARADADHRLAVLAVAMWQYRLKHGQFPKELGLLVPEFALSVPVDPFTGQSMKIARRDNGLAIYSVGPDLTDDGGTPLDQKREKGDIRLLLGK